MKKLFLLGAVAYPVMELLYRGRTHYSMALAGGLSAMLIGHMGRMRMWLPFRAMLCGAGITAIEYAIGCLWNRRYSVWDYRDMSMNIQGQVCLPYTLLWCGLSAAALKLLPRRLMA